MSKIYTHRPPRQKKKTPHLYKNKLRADTDLIVVHIIAEPHVIARTRARLQVIFEVQVQVDVVPVEHAARASSADAAAASRASLVPAGRPPGILSLAAVQLELRAGQSGVHPHASGQLATASFLQ